MASDRRVPGWRAPCSGSGSSSSEKWSHATGDWRRPASRWARSLRQRSTSRTTGRSWRGGPRSGDDRARHLPVRRRAFAAWRWTRSASPIPPVRGRPSSTSPSRYTPGRWWPWQGRTGRARRRWPSSWPASTPATEAPSAGTGWSSPTSTPTSPAAAWPSSSRTSCATSCRRGRTSGWAAGRRWRTTPPRGSRSQAGAHHFLSRLSARYDTWLGPEFEGGTDLSIGQWQRIALARAFFRGAPFVILDEPTAALDARAEHELFARIREEVWLAPSVGFEPTHPPPEGGALSPELRGPADLRLRGDGISRRAGGGRR